MSKVELKSITPEILMNESIIRIYGHKYVIIENYKSIIEYTDRLIRLQGKNERIIISGVDLCIAFFNLSDMRIDGFIASIVYE